MLIEITGIDGSGKTTLISQLRKNLNAHPLTWAYERNFKHRGKRFLEHLSLSRGLNRPEELFDVNLIEFHNALEMLEESHKQFFYLTHESQLIYFVDQYYTSWIANAIFRNVSIIEELKFIYSCLPSPHISIYLDVTAEIALDRLKGRLKGDQVLNTQNPLLTLSSMKECFERSLGLVNYKQIKVDANRKTDQVYHDVFQLVWQQIQARG